jgi:hypothetical protein
MATIHMGVVNKSSMSPSFCSDAACRSGLGWEVDQRIGDGRRPAGVWSNRRVRKRLIRNAGSADAVSLERLNQPV